jgi:hypothetical protein
MDYVKPGATASQINTFMAKLLECADYFVIQPASIVGAEFITRADITLS